MESLFTIDEDKCKKDGICASACPMAIIDFSNADLVPKPAGHAESICIKCGHCVAVCPHGALSHRNISPEDCLEVEKSLMLTEAQMEQFLRYRRSIRNYKDKPVEKDKLNRLIEISSHAPSGHNTQPVHWQVIYGQDKVKEYSVIVIDWMKHTLKEQPEMGKMLHFDMIVAAWDFGVDVVSRSCSALVLTNGGAQDPFADAASKIAMTFFDLAAPTMGLGTCWNGYFNMAILQWEPLREALKLPENMTNFGVMMVGYPKFKYSRMPTRNAPRISWLD